MQFKPVVPSGPLRTLATQSYGEPCLIAKPSQGIDDRLGRSGFEDRRWVCAVETPVNTGHDRAAGTKRFDLGKAQYPLPHLPDDDVETAEKRADLGVWNASYKIDIAAISGYVRSPLRPPVETCEAELAA